MMFKHIRGRSMKPLTKIFILLGLIAAIAGFLTYDAFNIAPKRYATRHETLSDEKIPRQLDDINILFFSDLEYGTFMNEERLNNLVDTINNISPDVIIFGGDLYDQEAIANADSNTILTNAFKSMDAPLGKYAVYGDNDRASSTRAGSRALLSRALTASATAASRQSIRRSFSWICASTSAIRSA